jgi:hypothetical protein
MEEPRPECVAAQQALEELIQIHKGGLQPAPTFDSPDLGGEWQLNEFIVVMGWTRLEDGQNHLTFTFTHNIPSWHVTGLLQEALESQWQAADGTETDT